MRVMRRVCVQQSTTRTAGSTAMSWPTRLCLSVLPVGVLLTATGLVSVVLPQQALLSLAGLVVLMMLTGKCVILAPVVHGTPAFSPLFLAHMVILTDACVAWFVTLNLAALDTLPWVGPGVRSLEAYGQRTLARSPWLRRMAMLGVTLFVAVPIPGTGAIGGTVLARLIGFGWLRSFLVVCLGTVIGAYGMAGGAQTLLTRFPPPPSSPWVGMLRLSIGALMIVVLSWIGRRRSATRRAGDAPATKALLV